MFNLSLISFRFTLSLFVFSFLFFGGGSHLKYLELKGGGAGKKFLNVDGGSLYFTGTTHQIPPAPPTP